MRVISLIICIFAATRPTSSCRAYIPNVDLDNLDGPLNDTGAIAAREFIRSMSSFDLLKFMIKSGVLRKQSDYNQQGEMSKPWERVQAMRQASGQGTNTFPSATTAIETTTTTICSNVPAGLYSRKLVKDSQFTASSSHDDYFKPSNARLIDDGEPWIPATTAAGEWIRVDLMRKMRLSGVVTIGRKAQPQFVKSFSVQYAADPGQFVDVRDAKGNKKIFEGNQLATERIEVTNLFEKPIVARWVTITVESFHMVPALRFELLVC